MKRIVVLLLLVCLCLPGCSRVGKADSLDLLAALKERGIDVSLDEAVSGADERTESGYVGAVRLSFRSDSSGKVERIVLTCMDASDPDFLRLSQTLTEIYCAVSPSFFSEIWRTLTAQADGGVAQCRAEQYLFTYSADAMGAVFLIDNQLLHPTEPPSVTVRQTARLLKESEPATR